jgi:hypothetical protein
MMMPAGYFDPVVPPQDGYSCPVLVAFPYIPSWCHGKFSTVLYSTLITFPGTVHSVLNHNISSSQKWQKKQEKKEKKRKREGLKEGGAQSRAQHHPEPKMGADRTFFSCVALALIVGEHTHALLRGNDDTRSDPYIRGYTTGMTGSANMWAGTAAASAEDPLTFPASLDRKDGIETESSSSFTDAVFDQRRAMGGGNSHWDWVHTAHGGSAGVRNDLIRERNRGLPKSLTYGGTLTEGVADFNEGAKSATATEDSTSSASEIGAPMGATAISVEEEEAAAEVAGGPEVVAVAVADEATGGACRLRGHMRRFRARLWLRMWSARS